MNYCYEYPRPAVTTDAIVLARTAEGIKILLIQRRNDPYQARWALPGGFINMNENLLVACERELEEETGLNGIELRQFRTYGEPNRDPRGRTISVVFWAIIEHETDVTAADDAMAAAWFLINQMPLLAFDHDQIIAEFIAELKL